jgi:multicomponent K+:H+ antiporter subunit G
MTSLEELPTWAALPAALFLLTGASLVLLGSVGLLRLRSFYERVHAPTLGTSLGTGCVLISSMIVFSALQTRLVLHEIVIGVFVIVTTPVTLMLLARAALYRDRLEGGDQVPQPSPPVADLGDRHSGAREASTSGRADAAKRR